ncbi:hypothetical protein Q5P01_021331 [Channa striata]|uniref:Uncharacterized protein n=1 Tax=Channa striata TaxID=64152 RepID=A0AA88LU36_CHASR|nr:hypothetical protein Q5P01_021331 [Channa striata]
MKVDIRAEFDDSIQEMEWEEVLEILKAAIEDVLDTPPNTPPPPPAIEDVLDTPPNTPPPPPVVLPTELGQVGDVHEAHQLPDVYSQGQNNQAPVINTYQNLVPIQLLNGQWVYPYTLCSPDTIAPPAPTSMSK